MSDLHEAAVGRTGLPLVVRPVRFTDDVAGVAGFASRLGLRVATEGDSGRWVQLHGAAGALAVHAASGARLDLSAGETALSFVVSDAADALRRLSAAGLAEATLWDEAYGRVVGVDDPHGVQLWFDEAQRDLYGYRTVASGREPTADCVPIVFTPLVERYVAFLEALGFVVDANHGDYVALSVPGGGGSVGVHRAEERAVELSYVSPEAPAECARRMRAAGYRVNATKSAAGPIAEAVDPDGRRVEIHPR